MPHGVDIVNHLPLNTLKPLVFSSQKRAKLPSLKLTPPLKPVLVNDSRSRDIQLLNSLLMEFQVITQAVVPQMILSHG